MGLKKGQTNNVSGQPKGTPNKITSDLKAWINDILDDNRTQFESYLKGLEPKDRLPTTSQIARKPYNTV